MDNRIAVCIAGDMAWAERAVYLACGLAQDTHSEVCLVKMVAVQHFSWLGTPLGYMDFDEAEFCYYVNIATDYKVTVSTCAFQYYDLADAIKDAAIYLNATVVFATLPNHMLNFWRSFQLRRLANNLQKQNCHLYTLDTPLDTVVWSQPAPAATVK